MIDYKKIKVLSQAKKKILLKQKRKRRRQDVRLIRRRYVAELMKLDFPVKMIVEELSDPLSPYYVKNPFTGKPYIVATIQHDIAQMEQGSRYGLQSRTRLDLVKSFMGRGMSDIEIYNQLSNPKKGTFMVHPLTKKPYSLETIQKDMERVREESIEIVRENVESHRARQLAEIRELRRRGYVSGQLQIVLGTLQTEIKLLGTAMPERSIVDVNQTITDKTAKDELIEEIERFANSPELERYRRLKTPDESDDSSESESIPA